MTERNFTDITIDGDFRNPKLVRAYCRTCNGDRLLKLKPYSGVVFLHCTACAIEERYDPEGLLSE